MEFTNFFLLVTDGKALIVCDDDYLSIIPINGKTSETVRDGAKSNVRN